MKVIFCLIFIMICFSVHGDDSTMEILDGEPDDQELIMMHQIAERWIQDYIQENKVTATVSQIYMEDAPGVARLPLASSVTDLVIGRNNPTNGVFTKRVSFYIQDPAMQNSSSSNQDEYVVTLDTQFTIESEHVTLLPLAVKSSPVSLFQSRPELETIMTEEFGTAGYLETVRDANDSNFINRALNKTGEALGYVLSRKSIKSKWNRTPRPSILERTPNDESRSFPDTPMMVTD